MVPILYGYPTPKAEAAADRGEIVLGGCCIAGGEPRKRCKACGEDLDFPRARALKERELGRR